MLKDLAFKPVYRTDDDSLLGDFYLPALSASTSYERAVGYFSSTMLSYAAQGLGALIEKQGTMKLIIGGEISQEEHDAILNGYDLRSIGERIGTSMCRTIDQVVEELSYARLQALAWMIANGSLSVKIALTRQGMYHEKIGIFRDSGGDRVVFQGSANETVNALLPDFNFESITVFPSWRPELNEYAEPFVQGFNRLWSNESKHARVLDFPAAAQMKLVQIAVKMKAVPSASVELAIWNGLAKRRETLPEDALPKVPTVLGGEPFLIKDHQKAALDAWRSQTFHGVLALATGAGKTITALYGATKLLGQMKRLFLVVAVPYTDLADQWIDEAALFNIHAIGSYDKKDNWLEPLSQAVHLFNARALPFVCTVVVNKTLQSSQFQELLTSIDGLNLMFVGDECHRHRSDKSLKALPLNAEYRLGLSATPDDPYRDESEADPLYEYYGSICSRYSLAQALADGVLTPYDYNIVLVDLTPEETEEYVALSQEISKRTAMSKINAEGSSDDSQLEMLLFQRARLIGSAQNKLAALKILLSGEEPHAMTLFYCGDGSVETGQDGVLLRQIEAVSQLLGDLGWRSSRFTSRESKTIRRQLLDDFKIGNIDALVAIRCLDEGINIPGCHTAYLLASSRNSRQFIQRRGRILRRAPGKDKALIYDFVVTLPESIIAEYDHEHQLFRSELQRIAEFSSLCLNHAAAYRQVEALLKRYNLVHEFV